MPTTGFPTRPSKTPPRTVSDASPTASTPAAWSNPAPAFARKRVPVTVATVFAPTYKPAEGYQTGKSTMERLLSWRSLSASVTAPPSATTAPPVWPYTSARVSSSVAVPDEATPTDAPGTSKPGMAMWSAVNEPVTTTP